MYKAQKNQNGFGVVEVLLALVFIAIVVLIGVYVAHNQNNVSDKSVATSTSTKSPAANTTSNSYAGWKTDSASLKGVSFKYPSTWTVTIPNSPTCTGAVDVNVTAPSSEISQAITASDYYLSIERYGTKSSNCGPDGMDFSGLNFDSVTSSDQVKNGIFSGNWLSFFAGGGNEFYPSQLDNAVLTPSSYDGSQESVNSSTVTVVDKTYQVGIVTSTASGGQVRTPANVDLASFKSSNLYKDTLNILNSIN